MIIAAAIASLALQSAEASDPEPFQPQGFRSQVVVQIDAPVEEVFEAATGDVSPWWDHSFALDPAELVIEPRFGGRFYERMEEGSDDGALHASIIYVDAPNTLRMDGPLGLQDRAYQLVTTWTLEEDEEGGTVFTVDLAMQTEIDEELAGVVTAVWVHFIDARLRAWVEAGCNHDPDAPCDAWE
jgi:uncharacterized protein YndB with AHSA1/START domain